jgi:maltooligosyltrehalose trehalohydrolase
VTATYHRPLPFGAEITADGTLFRLWAPAEKNVQLVLEDTGRLLPMSRDDGGWFTVRAAAPTGARYRYQLDNGLRVPDPASRFQPDDVHGPSLVVDPKAFTWASSDWRGRPWEDAIFYEAHIGCFTREGTYDAMRRKLDHLAKLGITAVELMPLSDFEGRRNWGYDGTLLFAPDSVYGTPADLKRLIDEAHQRGIMMFLDVVYNHFGPVGNYIGLYAPQFFTDHHHTPWGLAINFEDHGENVRKFFIENAHYWIEEYRFDGLRFDAIQMMMDSSARHVLDELAEAVLGADKDRHVHLVLENANNTARYLERYAPVHFAAQWNDDFHHATHVAATGDTQGYYIDYAVEPVKIIARCLAEGFHFQGQPFKYWDEAPRGEDCSRVPLIAFINFLQNHDQIGNRPDAKRLAALIPSPPLRALTALTLLAPQIPLLFMGEEWATTKPFNFFCDFHGDLAEAVSRGRYEEFKRFHVEEPDGSRPPMPDPNSEETFKNSQLDWDELAQAPYADHLRFVAELIDIRRRLIIPRLNGLMPRCARYEVEGRALFVQWTLGDGCKLALAANLSARAGKTGDWTLPGQPIFLLNAEAPAGPLAQLDAWAVAVSLDPAP